MPCGKPTERQTTVGGRQITYELHRSAKRRKTISLKIEGDGLRVLAPSRTSLRHVDEVVQQKADWIAERLAEPPPSRIRDQLKPGGQLPLLGEQIPVGEGLRPFSYHHEPLSEAGPSFSVDPYSDHIVEEAERWFRAAARVDIEDRVSRWSHEVEVAPMRIQIRDQKTRWGSASSRGTLSFSWRLIFAPPEIVDYVVVHELCHLIEPNHSKNFWNLVDEAMPNAQHWRQQLKEIGDSLTW